MQRKGIKTSPVKTTDSCVSTSNGKHLTFYLGTDILVGLFYGYVQKY